MEALKKRKDMVKFSSPQKLKSPPPLNVHVLYFFEFPQVKIRFFITSTKQAQHLKCGIRFDASTI